MSLEHEPDHTVNQGPDQLDPLQPLSPAAPLSLELARTNAGLLRSFLGSFKPKAQEELFKLVTPHVLDRADLEQEIEKSRMMLGHLEATRERLVRNDPENPDLDIELMRRFFFYSFVGRLRDFKFYTNPETEELRPELEIMRRVLEATHHHAAGAYINEWTRGIKADIHDLPDHPPIESPRELKARFQASLDDAILVLPGDTVLGRIMKLPLAQQQVAEIIFESKKDDPIESDKDKERLINDLRRKILVAPVKYLGHPAINRLNSGPDLLLAYVLRHPEWAPGFKSGEEDSAKRAGLKQALASYARLATLDRRARTPAHNRAEFAPVIDELAVHFPAWVIQRMRANPYFLSGLVLTDLIAHRLRNLNKICRMMNRLRDEIDTYDVLSESDNDRDKDGEKKRERIRKTAAAIINLDGRTGHLIEERGGTGHLVRAEFVNYVSTVIGKLKTIETAHRGGMGAERYQNVNVRTSKRLWKLLDGLRTGKQCLSFDFPCGEAHFTIPEMLFSATSDTLLLEGPGKKIEASLTLRFMPALVEGQLEPVLFRQKMRLRNEDDMYRLALNDMAVALAARCGATRIIMTSGFIGNPEAFGHRPELYSEGFEVSYTNPRGRLVQERVRLSHRREIPGTELLFIEPEISPGPGFHAHDDKLIYPDVSREICGIKCRVFRDPADRARILPGMQSKFWVVDITRERIGRW